MNFFLTFPESERAAVFTDVGAQMGILPFYVEKDFWVCWVLNALFTSPDLSPHLAFRGGTSLSKAYGAINRFSEDIDLSISREWLGVTDETDPALAANQSQADRRQQQLRIVARQKLQESVLPILQEAIDQSPVDKGSIILEAEGEAEPFDTSRDPYCIYFIYPTITEPIASGYITARVKIELSARAESFPEESRCIRSFAAEHYPNISTTADPQITTVTPDRTFWEKAFIIHEANTAPEKKAPQPRLARHYYDLYQLIVAGLASTDPGLFLQVREHRRHYFRQTWVDYTTITPEQFAIIPPDRLQAHWQSDYESMASMIYGPIPPLADILPVIESFVKSGFLPLFKGRAAKKT